MGSFTQIPNRTITAHDSGPGVPLLRIHSERPALEVADLVLKRLSLHSYRFEVHFG